MTENITSTNAERALGLVFVSTVVGFGVWLHEMEMRSAALEKHLGEIRKIGASFSEGADELRKISASLSEGADVKKKSK